MKKEALVLVTEYPFKDKMLKKVKAHGQITQITELSKQSKIKSFLSALATFINAVCLWSPW